MNEAHLHLLINHFPIVGTIFAAGILIAGLILKNPIINKIAFILFVSCAAFTAISMKTGEGAEEIAERLPNITHELIHEHEEKAETFALFTYINAALSIIGLFFIIRKNPLAKTMTYLILILAAITIFFSKDVGTTGGEIRHTEIRSDFVPAHESNSEAETEHND